MLTGIKNRVGRFVSKRLRAGGLQLAAIMALPPWKNDPGPSRGIFLVTGPSGVGKSTVAAVLSACGYDAIDADENFACAVSRADGSRVDILGRTENDLVANYVWVWDRQKTTRFLTAPRGSALFFCGGADNEAEFYPFFDIVFFLCLPESTLQNRLLKRPVDDPTRRTDRIATTLREGERLRQEALARGWDVIDARQPLSKTVRHILQSAALRCAAADRRHVDE